MSVLMDASVSDGFEVEEVGRYFGRRMPRTVYILIVSYEHHRRLSGAVKRVIETTIANALIPSNGRPSHPEAPAQGTPKREKIQRTKEKLPEARGFGRI
jgi:hypothetical protein